MSDPIKKQESVIKRLSRGNWLRNAAVTATGAVMLFLTGCTKEVSDMLPGHGGGGLGSTPDQWYSLKIIFKDKENKIDTGYLAVVDDWHPNPDWSYMKIGNKTSAAKFKLHPADIGGGWQWWEVDDSYWLTMSGSGWVYRADYDQKVAWKIISGKMYTNWSWYQNLPLGTAYYSFGFVTPAYYVGASYDPGPITEGFTCELVPAP